jgi:erythromycin esterase
MREDTLARLISSLTTMFVVTMLPFAPPVRGGQKPSEPDRTIALLEPGKPVERALDGGESHGYLVPLKAGHFLHLVVDQRGIDLVVKLVGPDGKRVAEVDSPNGDQGPEPVQVVAAASGDYRLEILPLEKAAKRGRYQVKIEELLTADQYAERLAAEKSRMEEVKKWLANHAIRLKGVEAGHGFEDMQPLKKVIGGARLVALGEATHGTREFFQLKHRMLEFLASEMGFTVFGIEATMPEGFDVNEFVLNGKGDPAGALAGLYFWTWDTEEVLDMIRWMRNYNIDPRHEKKVKFYGFDAQFPVRATRVALAYLAKVDGELPTRTKEALSPVANQFLANSYNALAPEKKQALTSASRELLDLLDRRKTDYVKRTGAGEWAVARQHAQVLAQYLAMNNPKDITAYSRVRDRSMADNVRWILEHEGPGTKIVLWAHNGHVATSAAPRQEWMGYHLRKMYGTDMVVFGFAFNQGSFQAVELPFGTGRLRSFDVKPAPDGSLDAMLAASGLALAAIDLRALPKDGPVASWFDQPHATRNLGAGYSEQHASHVFSESRVPLLYDALLFVEKTTTARANRAGERPKAQKLPAPANLDFESGDPGMTPADWIGPSGINGLNYEIATSEDHPYTGRRCAIIRRKPGPPYGETFGRLGQTIDAKAFQGRRIRLRAAIRAEVAGAGNQAHLWLRIQRPGFGAAALAFEEDMADRPITTEEWRVIETVGDVPKDADRIDYGLALVGEGRAWLDSVTLEVVDK